MRYEEKTPMYKLEPLLSYVRYKWKRGWRPGKNVALDEMTIGFKGRCAMVTRIKYKKEGDGFQCDCICEDGYCYTFWFRCDVPPRPAPDDVSARDNRCLWLVEQLPGMWYNLWMDNLFTSFKFGKMLADRQCLFGGTCQTVDWRGLHSKVVQKEEKTAKGKAEKRGTILASYRSDGLPANCEIICTSYYDEESDKPFHMMSNIIESVEIKIVRKSCFSTNRLEHFTVELKRLSLGYLYNQHMNSVDISDQLRMVYRPDGLWMRCRKWLWSIMLWALGQAITNGYIQYKAQCTAAGKRPMKHLDLTVAVAEAWCTTPQIVLNPKNMTAAKPVAAVTERKTAPYLTDKYMAQCKESYEQDKAAHEVMEADLQTSGRPKVCQLCDKDKCGKGKRAQDAATMKCAQCGISVCSGRCWQWLHGVHPDQCKPCA